ncbi:PUA-like domain-containing protein [Tricladium varicosporioides]|nr:PUA-like domain-containing protein [Hymenoscyphus varicosporioides]
MSALEATIDGGTDKDVEMIDEDIVVISGGELKIDSKADTKVKDQATGFAIFAEQTQDSQPLTVFEPREVVAEFVEEYLLKYEEPVFDNNLLLELGRVLKLVAVRLKFNKEVEKITKEDMDKIFLLLYWIALVKKKEFVEVNKKYNIKGKLQAIGDPSYNFPKEHRQIAQAFSKEFEAENWGIPPEPKRLIKATRVAKCFHQRHSTSSEPNLVKSKADKSEAVVKYPPKDHKIFGPHGCMHHILISQSEYTKTYILDHEYTQKDFRNFGHNDLEVGACWPMQVAAWRDGTRVGGISGTADRGCYSIVVSGAYRGLDRDTGDTLYYTTANAHDGAEKNTNTKENSFTKSLILSIQTVKPVRVLRTSKCDWAGAPRIGIRYDGLYQVLSYKASKSEEKGAYLIFQLKRLADQNPINKSRPTWDEEQQFEEVQQGY